MTPRVRHRRRALTLGAVLVVVAGTGFAAMQLHQARVAVHQAQSAPLAVGDCVTVTASAPDIVETRPSPCTQDPSYTIGALTGSTGRCPTAEYQHFAAPAADRATAGLCLVPNLVAEHCYRLSMPIGVVARSDCAPPSTAPAGGVLVQITARLDVHDRHACPASGGLFAWPYPSPARTYCTATLS